MAQLGGGMRFALSNNYLVQGVLSNDLLLWTATSNQSWAFGASNNSNMLLRITSNGYVGIGTSNPVAALDVRGGAVVAGSNVEFPPQAMPGFTTVLSNAAYGNGTYIASSSSSNFGAVAPFFAYYAFDKTSNNDSLTWVSQSAYSASTGVYSGVFNTSNDVATYGGEWVQLQMPVPVALSSVTIVPPVATINRSPRDFAFFGSLDGNSWYQLGSNFSGVTFVSNTGQSFPLNARQHYPYVRFVVNKTQPSGDSYAMVSELRLFGSYQGASTVVSPSNATALTVPGNLYCGGNFSAPNMGMFRNRVINGDMRIDQRNSGAVVTGQASTYILDRWNSQENAAQVGRMSMCRSNVPAPHPLGLQTCMKAYVTTANASPANFDYLQIWQTIEGYNVADLNYGTTMASPVTLSFWAYSSKNGTFPVSFTSGNIGTTRAYVTSYTINTINVWQQVVVTVPGDQAQALASTTNSGGGFCIKFAFGPGAGLQTATVNQWNTFGTVAIGPTGATNFYDTVGNTIHITGVQLERGTTATPFELRPFPAELQLCQRYLTVIKSAGQQYQRVGMGLANSTSTVYLLVHLPVAMRNQTALGLTYSGNADFSVFGLISGTVNSQSITNMVQSGPSSDSGPNILSLTITTSATLTSGSAYFLMGTTTTGYIYLASEI